MHKANPDILILGANFAGLGTAQKIREHAGDAATITVIDRKTDLIFIPNIPADVFEGRDPALTQRMDVVKPLARDKIAFIQGEVTAVDVDRKAVTYTPAERPGAAPVTRGYDILVIALGNRLAFDRIEGFAEHGFSVSDIYQGNRLRHYLENDYKGGPIAVGSALFHQGDGAEGLAPYPGGTIPRALAACEGPPVEVMLSAATWLTKYGLGGPDRVHVFTPAQMIAEDAGEEVVTELLGIAGKMGFHYHNAMGDIARITEKGVVFADGRMIEAEVPIIFPNWEPHAFLKGLPISDSEGFIRTDLTMRNPDYPEVYAVGDAAAVTVPKLGAIGHQQAEIAARHIAHDIGALPAEELGGPLQPLVYCIGDMGGGEAFYIRSNSWFGGDTEVLKMGRIPYALKMQYRQLFLSGHGKVPSWGLNAAELLAEGRVH